MKRKKECLSSVIYRTLIDVKANVLEVSMQLVEQQCGRYLTNFSNCLQKFPYTWHVDCERQKLKLAKCAEAEPTIVKIKMECEREFKKYERCMNVNPVETHYCLEDFAQFNKCAERYTPPSEKEDKPVEEKPTPQR